MMISNSSEGDVDMVVRCIQRYGNQILEGKQYYCFAVGISLRNKTISYRIVNEKLEIACYDADCFELEKNSLNAMIISVRDSYCDVNLAEIARIDQTTKNVSRTWEKYHDGNNELLEKLIHDIVIKSAALDGVFIDRINTV